MVRECDPETFVVIVHQALAVRGYDPVITHENGPQLVRLSRQMLAEFGIGGETAEENDGMGPHLRA